MSINEKEIYALEFDKIRTMLSSLCPTAGAKEKALAAFRNGIKTIIIPKENQKDLVEIPKEIFWKPSFAASLMV